MEHPIAPGSVAPRVAGMHLAWGDHHHGARAQRDYLLAETERAAAFVHDPDRKGRMRVRAVAAVGAGGLPTFDHRQQRIAPENNLAAGRRGRLSGFRAHLMDDDHGHDARRNDEASPSRSGPTP